MSTRIAHNEYIDNNKECHSTEISVHTGWCLGCTGSIIWPVSQRQLWSTGSSQLLFLLLLPRFFLFLLALPLLRMFCKQFTNIRLLLLLSRLIFIHLSKHHNTIIYSVILALITRNQHTTHTTQSQMMLKRTYTRYTYGQENTACLHVKYCN